MKGTSNCAVVGGLFYPAPAGLRVVRWDERGGTGAELHRFTDPRKRPVRQAILHRGAETLRRHRTYAHATVAILKSRKLSTELVVDVDGTVYQVHDPADHRGRHCAWHNVVSDGIDVAGPFSRKWRPVAGQEPLELDMAIGRKGDHVPGHRPYYASVGERRHAPVQCWSMPPAQAEALALLLPWWCELRGIPLQACADLRTFRRSAETKERDPVCAVEGVVAHMQVSDPGRRVDGALPLWTLARMGAGIDWREWGELLGADAAERAGRVA